MTHYNLKVAYRKALQNKTSSITKIVSLTVGLLTLAFIGIYTHHQLSFDNFHSNKANLYRVNTTISTPANDMETGLSATPVGPYLKEVEPKIRAFTRITQEYGTRTLGVENQLFSESDNILYADANFLQLFDFDLLHGDREKALEGPNRILLTEAMALKYFGNRDIVGKEIRYDTEIFEVSGVLKDIPTNSQLEFEFLISMETFMSTRPTAGANWSWLPMHTFLLLESSADFSSVYDNMANIPRYQPNEASNEAFVLGMEPCEGIHFSPAKLGELGSKAKLSHIYALLVVGVMILLLAVSNYINLSISQISTQRKEVSVKKVMGASTRQIFSQFFTESWLYSAISCTIALALAFGLSQFSEILIGSSVDWSIITWPVILAIGLSMILILAMISGAYPAFRFASIPQLVLHTSPKSSSRFLNVKSGLLIFQFAITSALIIGSLIIYNQLSFLQNKDLGMQTDATIVIDYGPNSGMSERFESIKHEISTVSGVKQVAFSSHIPGEMPNGVTTVINDDSGKESSGEINLTLVDYDFMDNYGIEVIAGRPFTKERFSSDHTAAIILNESAVKAFGYASPEDIIGASYEQWGGNGTVIGVVSDFNYLSLHNEVGLLSLKMWTRQFQKISLKIDPGRMSETLADLRVKWKELFPEVPFNHYFINESLASQYVKDRQLANIVLAFTFVSILIGMLGLIAFATFWCERKKKEISIRKVLGAQEWSLIFSFFKEFSLPVIISFIIAVPIAFYVGREWLAQFAYQMNLNWTHILYPILALMLITAVSVVVQSTRVVLANPIQNLNEG